MKTHNHQTLIVGNDKLLIQSIQKKLARLSSFQVVTRLSDLEESQLSIFSLVLVLHAPPEENGLLKLERFKFFGLKMPIVLIGKTLTQEVLLSAFRLGATDVWDTQNEENISLRFEKLMQQSKRNRSKRNIKSWLDNIKIPNEFLGIIASFAASSKVEFSAPSTSDLSVQFLGKFQIFIKGKSIDIALPNKSKALLVYLLLHRRVSRSKLLQTFWRGQYEDAAKNSLNVSICQIRKWFKSIDLEVNYIICKGDHYEINQNLVIETDYEHFRAAYLEARNAEQEQDKEQALNAYFKAYANYRGNFVEDLSKEEWIESERNTLEEHFLSMLDQLCQLFLEAERFPVAWNIADKILRTDFCMEKAHRYKMVAYWKMGKNRKSIEQFHCCKRILKEELGINPGQKTLALYEEVLGG